MYRDIAIHLSELGKGFVSNAEETFCAYSLKQKGIILVYAKILNELEDWQYSFEEFVCLHFLIRRVDDLLFPDITLLWEFKDNWGELLGLERVFNQVKEYIDNLMLVLLILKKRNDLLAGVGRTNIVERQQHLINDVLFDIWEYPDRQRSIFVKEIIALEFIAIVFSTAQGLLPREGFFKGCKMLIILIQGIDDFISISRSTPD